MNEETKIEVKYDPYNGDYVIEQPEKDVIRVQRWIWAVIEKQITRGEIEIWEP